MSLSRRTLLQSAFLGSAGLAASPLRARTASVPSGTSVQLIRSATIKVTLGSTVFLIDPMLSARGTWPGFVGTVNA